MNSDEVNIFSDKNISVFYFLEIIIHRWKFLILMVFLSLPLSGIYYLVGEEVFESTSMIMIGKRYASDRVYMESPIILAKRIKSEYYYSKNINKITVEINSSSFFEVAQRTIQITLRSDSAAKAQKMLSDITGDIIEKHDSIYRINPLISKEVGAIRTAVVLKPTLSEKAVNKIDYTIFIKTGGVFFLIGCLIALFMHQIVLLRKNKCRN